uniref:C2H2-type domain-containing protein n=1 Tax=viral metagenome TaxID=1070528 RepID=A0A6C0D9X4_9ZZZZ
METNCKYFCKICNFTTNKKGNWNNHITTRKHLSNKNEKIYLCKCGLQYKHMSSLCKHKKKCNTITNDNTIDNTENDSSLINYDDEKRKDNTDIIMEFLQQSKDMQKLLIEQNRELQNTVVELSKKQTITNNYQQNNITNNNFNLNLFLNEQCKDAINITDFIESIQLTVSDLEATGRLGYVPGISRILVNKLKELDVYTRPLHCTDLKRETVYVKNNNSWEKECSHKNKMRHVIKRIAKKNLQQLPAWQAQNPDFIKLDTQENNDYLKISLNSLGSCDPENEEKDMNKIMRNVLKEVVVEK